MVAHNTGSTVICSQIKLAYYNLKLYELEIYDLIVAKVALKVYRYRYRHRGKSLFTYRLLTELKIPLPYISDLSLIRLVTLASLFWRLVLMVLPSLQTATYSLTCSCYLLLATRTTATTVSSYSCY